MKIPVSHSSGGGFTLAEILTAMAIFCLLVAATVSSQIFGLKMYRISEAKLSCASSARVALNRVQNEVRTASLLYIGSGTGSAFTAISSNRPCLGNALKICATSDTNSYVYYFVDASRSCLLRKTSASSKLEIVSNYVTNQVVFRAEDYLGNTLTNNFNDRIIRMDLEFSKVEFPTSAGGNANLCEAYRLQTRMVRRAL